MRMRARATAVAIAIALVIAVGVTAPAAADDFCVGDGPGCHETLAGALAAARANAEDVLDRVLLPAGDHEVPDSPVDAARQPVELIGQGPSETRLTAAPAAATTLRLVHGASRARGLTVAAPPGEGDAALRTAGIATDVDVRAAGNAKGLAVRLDPGGALLRANVEGLLEATPPVRVERVRIRAAAGVALLALGAPGAVIADTVLVRADEAEAAFAADCPAELEVRHATVAGTAGVAARTPCVRGASSLLAAGVAEPPGDGWVVADAATLDGELRPLPGSPAVDAGVPGPLSSGHALWDLGGRPRAADGDGDGVPRRDAGAWELQPPPTAAPSGNVLADPGAELGAAAWTRTGSFTAVPYGTREADGADLLPTEGLGEAIGGGRGFFSAGTDPEAALLQRIDLTSAARAVDRGAATAALSGLLGGYGADADAVRLTATYRDPSGVPLGVLRLDGPSPADRAHATTLLARAASGTIPARTRAIDVVLAGTRIGADGERYTDAYADNVALVLSVPGVPVDPPVDQETPPVAGLKPFAGVRVLGRGMRLSPRGTVRNRLACASSTVGRCRGTLELRARLRPRRPAERIARTAAFSVAAGRRAAVSLRLRRDARRALGSRRSFRATLLTVARDGQGLERRTTVPLRVRGR